MTDLVFGPAFVPIVVPVTLMIVAAVALVIARIATSRDRRRLDFLDLHGLSVAYGDRGLFGVVRRQDGTSEVVGVPHHELRTVIDSAMKEVGG